MELKITISERDLIFTAGKLSGKGLENLIKTLGKEEFGTVILEGESASYTFLRQVALLVNLLVELKNVKLVLNSSSFKQRGGLVIPLYK